MFQKIQLDILPLSVVTSDFFAVRADRQKFTEIFDFLFLSLLQGFPPFYLLGDINTAANITGK